jgi:hypothetical protein
MVLYVQAGAEGPVFCVFISHCWRRPFKYAVGDVIAPLGMRAILARDQAQFQKLLSRPPDK